MSNGTPSRMETGGLAAAENLLPLVYAELRELAAARLAQEKPGQTLQATALVHEAYLKLAGDQNFADQRHFFRVAAQAMRQILIDRARKRQSVRHGGQRQRVELTDVEAIDRASAEELLALDEALDRFCAIDPAKAELVKLRYFGGLSEAEAAEALGVSRATASRHWQYARAWLIDALERGS